LLKSFPRTCASLAQNTLESIWIIEIEERCRRPDICSPEAQGMKRIPRDVSGPAFVLSDNHATGMAVNADRRRVMEGTARHQFLGLLGVGHNLLLRGAHAAIESRQRDGCAHELQESPSRKSFVPNRRTLRKFIDKPRVEIRGATQFLKRHPQGIARNGTG